MLLASGANQIMYQIENIFGINRICLDVWGVDKAMSLIDTKKLSIMNTNETTPVYMATAGNGPWDEQPQTYLGVIAWGAAVEIAKAQTHKTRLSTSAGYNNQGYYFMPERETAN